MAEQISDLQETLEEQTRQILALAAESKFSKARFELTKLRDVDIAEVIGEAFDRLGPQPALWLFRMLPKDVAADVFAELDPDDRLTMISHISDPETFALASAMDFDDMIDLLEELPSNIVDKILEQTPPAKRKQINTFLNYPENSAGGLMTPEYVTLQQGWTVAEALAHIKVVGLSTETVYTCYVKDRSRHLVGITSLRNLVTEEPDTKIADLMITDFVTVNVLDDREEVSEVFKRYGYIAIPVVDGEKRLVGIITMDDIIEVIEDENTEDIERMGGVIDAGDSADEYFNISVWRHVRARLPWLVLLMLTAMVTGAVIAHFEGTLSKVISLTVYLPMLMGTGGNSGSQAATLVIRGMSVGDIRPAQWWKVAFKELRVSALIGLCLAALNFLRIYLFEGQPLGIAVIVCTSLALVVILAKCVGSLLPIAAKRIGIDPALMAAPMISSITDTFSCLIYFSIAGLVLSSI